MFRKYSQTQAGRSTLGRMTARALTAVVATAATTALLLGSASSADAKTHKPVRCHDKVVSVSTVTFDDGTEWRVTKSVTRCRGKIAGYGELWEPVTP